MDFFCPDRNELIHQRLIHHQVNKYQFTIHTYNYYNVNRKIIHERFDFSVFERFYEGRQIRNQYRRV